MLSCGHNICPLSFENLFTEKKITCPVCKKETKCTKLEDLPKNYVLIDILSLEDSQEEKFIAIDISKLNISQEIDELFTLNSKIKEENKLIEQHFAGKIAEIEGCRDRILRFNRRLMTAL